MLAVKTSTNKNMSKHFCMWGPIECGMRKVANWSVMKYIRNILYERVSIKDEILTHDELLHRLKAIRYKYMYEFSHSAHVTPYFRCNIFSNPYIAIELILSKKIILIVKIQGKIAFSWKWTMINFYDYCIFYNLHAKCKNDATFQKTF